MKIGRFGPSLSDYKVELPHEIISVILSFITLLPKLRGRKRTLWSCCLLSKLWYAAAVPHLYYSPLLSNRNFDLFARTICPPVNSHVRHVGLEMFICHLDMGSLAYESSKSLTARLLRRTRMSLQTFVAPAVSFSITCLAPLSKCLQLQSLDLSHGFYDMDLNQLLHAVCRLPCLTNLSLHKGAMKSRCPLKLFSSEQSSWPARLSHLQINDLLPNDVGYWIELIASWPPTITSITFENCLSWDPFFQLHQSDAKAENITTLRIVMRRDEDGFPIEILLIAFPGLLSLTIPAPARMSESAINVSGLPGRGENLKSLAFSQAPDVVQPKAKLTTRFLRSCIEIHPNLVKIEIPESCVQIDEMAWDDLNEMNNLISTRGDLTNTDAGIFLV